MTWRIKMNQEFFADGISSIHITGNLVRIDFASVQPQTKNKSGQPIIEVNRRLIMPIEGFLKAIELQEGVVKQLVETGVLKVSEPNESTEIIQEDKN